MIADQKPKDGHPWVSSSPRLLVSVRNAVEAQAALEGGADIIDVKDPHAGSLGRAQPHAIREVAEHLMRVAPRHGLSVALGELANWRADAALDLPDSVQWVKLGLSDCVSNPGWYERWQECRRQVEKVYATSRVGFSGPLSPIPMEERDRVRGPSVVENAPHPHPVAPADGGDGTRKCGLGWIAVAYADHDAARAPSLHHVLAAAIQTRCAGVLLDTFTKRGHQLGDWIAPDELGEWLTTARQHGLLTAVAGSLQIDDLSWLCPLQPDIIAIRSAACQQGVRTAAIDVDAVARICASG